MDMNKLKFRVRKVGTSSVVTISSFLVRQLGLVSGDYLVMDIDRVIKGGDVNDKGRSGAGG